MAERQLISNAIHVSYNPIIGDIRDETKKEGRFDKIRPKKISNDFPNLYLTRHEKAIFINHDEPVVLIDNDLVLETTLAYQIRKFVNPLRIQKLGNTKNNYKKKLLI